ncbi:MAG: T9SS type A sorting domain-containing protein [Bacteroidetes bacterium]|nr:T9SS type A sorting domain-containing protein [Bacteroidota bacterium]
MKNKFTLLLAGVFSLYASNTMAQKNCVIEEFSSATCNPCASMNSWLDPLFTTNNANKVGSGLVVVKYQMNFPTYPNLDASYNAHGQARASYYIAGMSSWGIPLHFTNGKWHDTATGGGTNSTMVQTEITNCKTGTPQVNITGTYKVKSLNATEDSIFITVTVTPTATLSGTYYLQVAATERFYVNNDPLKGHYTSQTDFYHVMRKMYPSASGTTVTGLTANTPQTFTFKDKITIGSVAINGFNWWDNPYDGNVVAFIEDHTPALRSAVRIMNGQVMPAQWVTGINTVSNFQNIKIMPNPSNTVAGVLFNVERSTNVNLIVTDMMGRTVYQSETVPADQNAQRILVPTTELANGLYNVTLRADDGSVLSQRLTVQH